ncbi:protein suppressor of hairy wing [Drosophila tropicalis]|uniref:protein suppressor of hairy wing n=1 Tax=Drosophila tropicalis TaxID=46794 RepID=UPI0035ABA867
MNTSKEGQKWEKETVVKIVDLDEVRSPSKDNKRPSTRMKLLNDVTGSTKTSSSGKTEKRSAAAGGGAVIKILNDDTSTPVRAEKRTSGGSKKTISPTVPAPAAVKILNDKRFASPVMETVKIKANPSKKKKMDHYVLESVKNENSKAPPDVTAKVVVQNDDEDDDDDDGAIAFILADVDDDEEGDDQEAAARNNGTKIVVSRDEDKDDDDDDEDDDEGDESQVVTGGHNTSANQNSIKEIVEHVCGKCYKTFRRVKSLKKHLEFCRYDSGYHLRKADMLKNIEKIEKDAVVMEKKDICFCCNESYDTFHLGHINCPDCPKSFKTQTSYERHIFITHSEFNTFPCSICNANLRSGPLLTLHEEQHKNRGKPYACKICGKDFTRSYHLKRHQKYSSCSANETDTMSCKVCDRVFYRLDNLRSHLKLHLGTQVVKKPEYMCHVCKNCFYSLSTLNIHIRTHTGEKPFDCDLCDKKFSALVALKKHRRYHTGEKPYSCTVCNQSFAVKEVLNRHMKRHTGERPHKCNECGKSFIQATQLRTHSKVHLRPYACDLCDEKFKTEKQLERHVKDHSRQKRASFTCSECKRNFRTADLLKEHMDAGDHTPKPQRAKRSSTKITGRTDCAICDKNFDSTDTLRKHIRTVHECDPDDIFGVEPPAAKQKKKDDKSTELVNAADEESAAGIALNPATDSIEGNGVVVREFLLDEGDGTAQTIVLENETYTILPLEGEIDGEEEPAGRKPKTESKKKSTQVSPVVKKEQRKSLAASLAEAIADKVDEEDFTGEVLTEEDVKLKENVAKLIDMLVDPPILKKYGWPNTSEETVLCKVIENCGHDLTKGGDNYAEMEYGSRMREYCKLLFTVVIHNDSIKSLLNNFPIDDVIEYVLGDEDQDDSDSKDKDHDDNDDIDDDEDIVNDEDNENDIDDGVKKSIKKTEAVIKVKI